MTIYLATYSLQADIAINNNNHGQPISKSKYGIFGYSNVIVNAANNTNKAFTTSHTHIHS